MTRSTASVLIGVALFVGILFALRRPLVPAVVKPELRPEHGGEVPAMATRPWAPMPGAIDPRRPATPPAGQEAANDFALEDDYTGWGQGTW